MALRLGFGPQDWDLGLKARIWASRLRYGPVGWGAVTKKEEKEEKEKEKIPLCEKRANLRPEGIELSSWSAVLNSGRADLWPERVDSGLQGLQRDDLRPERADFRFLKANLMFERADLRPERADSLLEPIAQGLYVVSNNHCSALHEVEFE